MLPDKTDLRPALLGENAARNYLGGIGHTKFWELIKTGELDTAMIGASTKVTLESCDRYVERARQRAAEKRREREGVRPSDAALAEVGA